MGLLGEEREERTLYDRVWVDGADCDRGEERGEEEVVLGADDDLDMDRG